MKNVPLFKVSLPEGIEQVLKPVLESGYISEGPKAAEFEQKLGDWIGNPWTALTSSGTMSLTIALRLAGVGSGTEVITSPMTCLASNEPILSLGGVPVWCDIDPATGNIDPAKVQELITDKTKAILFVDWAGTPCELSDLSEIAHGHGLKTIEDAAHSFGAQFAGKKVGQLGDYVCFSHQAIKHLTTIDGGSLSCASQDDYERAKLLRWFGCRRGHNDSPIKWEGDVVEYGYKGHMNDVNATIGLEQLKTIDSRIDIHKKNGSYLTQALEDCPNVETLKIPDYIDSSHWIYTIKCKNSIHREKVATALTEAGIRSGIVHTRNDWYSLFEGSRKRLPRLDDFGSRMLSVPCGWWAEQNDLDNIVKVLHEN